MKTPSIARPRSRPMAFDEYAFKLIVEANGRPIRARQIIDRCRDFEPRWIAYCLRKSATAEYSRIESIKASYSKTKNDASAVVENAMTIRGEDSYEIDHSAVMTAIKDRINATKDRRHIYGSPKGYVHKLDRFSAKDIARARMVRIANAIPDLTDASEILKKYAKSGKQIVVSRNVQLLVKNCGRREEIIAVCNSLAFFVS